MHLRFVRLLVFHFSSAKRETIDIVHAVRVSFSSVRTLGHSALVRTNGHPAYLEVLGP
jgi:hypothetical protein